ncbi:hypothetical protein RB653_007313 [Dictyostelium firmibasis]|uniref:Uncharacterized protein n=1 Tax=Dictyostelium firmibasis TaxID=79012 RepID=A0AAN7YUJ2_9MYCE
MNKKKMDKKKREIIDCIQHSNDFSCVNYEYSISNIKADINRLCGSMPYMSVCTIQKLCKEVKSTNGICQEFSMLGDSCLHDMPGMSGCNNFKKLCSKDSVVKQCSKIQIVKNLPKTMELFTNIKSICNEMIMEGCEKCTKLNMECEVLPIYSSLCIDMGDMLQCQNWTKMCDLSGSLFHSPITQRICGAKD